MLSEKLVSFKLLISISFCWSMRENLGVLMTHNFPNLQTLILQVCELVAKDLQSLGRADSEGKLPVLKHLDISEHYDLKVSDLVANSAGWKQLTFLGTCDGEVLNAESEVFCSLQKLNLWGRDIGIIKSRPWPKLQEIQFGSERILRFIADHVKESFPAPEYCKVFCYTHSTHYLEAV